ncbi:DeSI-like protein At4g17486, partial [Linum perenne]
VEYAFGAHDFSTTGVFEVEPRNCPGYVFRRSVFMGTTTLDPKQVREFMEVQSGSYNGDMYHLIFKNCNHFSQDICYRLTGKSIPKWVNRLAKIGKSLVYESSFVVSVRLVGWIGELINQIDIDCVLIFYERVVPTFRVMF